MQRPFTAVRSIGLDLGSVLDRCRAYEPLLRAGEAFSHQTAAMLLGAPLPEAGPLLHVIAPPGLARPRGRGIAGHTSHEPVPVVLRLGLPVVEPALVWCQLAATLDRKDLVAVGDALVTGARTRGVRGESLTDLAELERAVGRWASRRGARQLAWALPRVRVGAESRPESLTRLVLVEHGLPEPVPNDPTPMGDGSVLHPDLKWEHWRIVLEYEGDGHRTSRATWQRDIRRKRDFEAAGWTVVRVTSDDLFVDQAAFIGRVRALIALAEARRHG
ncbi:hypothetical protein ACWGST_15810 [Agromyces sp. NPDC055520]